MSACPFYYLLLLLSSLAFCVFLCFILLLLLWLIEPTLSSDTSPGASILASAPFLKTHIYCTKAHPGPFSLGHCEVSRGIYFQLLLFFFLSFIFHSFCCCVEHSVTRLPGRLNNQETTYNTAKKTEKTEKTTRYRVDDSLDGLVRGLQGTDFDE